MATNARAVRASEWREGRSWLNGGFGTVGHHLSLWLSVAGLLLLASIAALLLISVASLFAGPQTLIVVQAVVHLASGPLALAVWLLILRTQAPTAHVTWSDWRHSALASVWWMVPVLAMGVGHYLVNDATGWTMQLTVGAVTLALMLVYGVATMFVPAILLESHRTTPMLSARPWWDSARLVGQHWRAVLSLFVVWAAVLAVVVAGLVLLNIGVGYALEGMHLVAYGATAGLVMQLLMALVFFVLGLAFNVSVAVGYHRLRPLPTA